MLSRSEIAVASFFLPLKDPGHDLGVGGFSPLQGAGWGCD